MEKITKKTYSIFCFIFAVFIILSCDPDEKNEDIIPPVQEILWEDTTGTMGDLLVDVYYLKEKWNDAELIPAPYGTSVYLYETEYDLDNDFPMYRFMVTDSNAVYMGYLEKKSYYVLAFDEMNGTYYEIIEKIAIRQRNEKATVTMLKIDVE